MRERIIEAARSVLGTIDLNPYQRGADDVGAMVTYTEGQGAVMPWPTVNTAWIEPSMLHGRTAYHVRVFLGYLDSRTFDTAIVLVPPRTAEDWWRDLTRHPRCRRMCLTHANGPAGSDMQWAVLLYCRTGDMDVLRGFDTKFDNPAMGCVWGRS